MFPEMRKYRLAQILGHQYMAQIEENVRDAILGNVGTIMAFRTGLAGAQVVEKEFYPEFGAFRLREAAQLPRVLKVDDRDGVVSKPFSAVTLIPCENGADTIVAA